VELDALVPVRWLWAFVALHGAFALIGFMLRQFEIALIGIRPYNAPHFPDCCICLSVLNACWGNLLVFCSSFGVAAIFRFLLFFRFPITGHSTPSMICCRCVGERCCVRFMAPQSKTRCLKTVMHPTPSVPLTRLKRKKPTRWLPPTGSGHRFWDSLFHKRWLHFFMLFVPVTGLWMSAVGVVGLALNLRAYDC